MEAALDLSIYPWTHQGNGVDGEPGRELAKNLARNLAGNLAREPLKS